MGDMEREGDGLSDRKVLLVSLLLFVNNFSVWMIFPFLPFLVLFYFPLIDITSIGYLSGIMGSAFSLGNLLGGFCWGLLVDSYGRRPVLLGGIFGTGLAAGIFGFSPNFWTAVFVRFIWGFCNGNIGITKAYISEIHDERNFAQGISVFGLVGGFGRICGPAIGGLLAQPADKYQLFQGTLFEIYPFALPSSVVVIFSMLIFLLTFFELTETFITYTPLHNRDEEMEIEIQSPPLSQLDSSLHTQLTKLDKRSHSSDIEMSNPNSVTLLKSLKEYLNPTPGYVQVSHEDSSSCHNLSHQEVFSQSQQEQQKKKIKFNGVVELQNFESKTCEYSFLKQIESDKFESLGQESQNKGFFSATDFHHPSVTYSNGSEDYPSDENDFKSIFWETYSYLFRSRMITFSLILYISLTILYVFAIEIFPLWLSLPISKGGFGMISTEIGLIITIISAVNLLSYLVLYPYLFGKFGSLQLFRIGVFVMIIAAFILPFSSTGYFAHHRLYSRVFMGIIFSSLTSAAGWAFVCVLLFIDNSCYTHQRQYVNTLGQVGASLARSIGPYCGSLLFAWAINSKYGWPFNFSFAWYIVACGSVVVWKLSQRLPKKIVKRRREPMVPHYALTMLTKNEKQLFIL